MTFTITDLQEGQASIRKNKRIVPQSAQEIIWEVNGLGRRLHDLWTPCVGDRIIGASPSRHPASDPEILHFDFIKSLWLWLPTIEQCMEIIHISILVLDIKTAQTPHGKRDFMGMARMFCQAAVSTTKTSEDGMSGMFMVIDSTDLYRNHHDPLTAMYSLLDRVLDHSEREHKTALGIRDKIKRKCRVCGCTDDDCRNCIERTGEPCYWVEEDLCSACADQKEGTMSEKAKGQSTTDTTEYTEKEE